MNAAYDVAKGIAETSGLGPAALLNGKRVVVVMPAFNAESSLRQTVAEIPFDVLNRVFLVDDGSTDGTVPLAHALGLEVFTHERNQGYGANQKTCYREALIRESDIVVMLHPDYQYSPRLITSLASLVASGHYDVALGSRTLGGGALKGGMPLYKYVANRVLSGIQNLATGAGLSEYHTGFRAYSSAVLHRIPWQKNSDDFVFDNQILLQAIHFGFRIGELSCPTRYAPESSSIGLAPSLRYGFAVLRETAQFFLARLGFFSHLYPNPDDGNPGDRTGHHGNTP